MNALVLPNPMFSHRDVHAVHVAHESCCLPTPLGVMPHSEVPAVILHRSSVAETTVYSAVFPPNWIRGPWPDPV